MNETIEWVDELPEKRWGSVAKFVEQLKSDPGRWAKYWPLARSSVGRVGRSNAKRYPGTEWAVRDWELYGRWIGDDA